MNLVDALKQNTTKYKVRDFYERSFNNTYSMKQHHHDQIEIMYVRSGFFIFNIYNKEGNKTSERIYEGQFVIIDSNIEHNIETPSNVRISNIEITMVPPQENEANIFALTPILHEQKDYLAFVEQVKGYAIINSTSAFVSLMKLVQEGLSNVNEINGDYLKSLLLSLLINVADCYKRTIKSKYTYYTNVIFNKVSNNLFEDISISQIAKELKISKSYLHRTFKKETGLTIIQYVNQKRMELAKQLLETTNMPIIDIVEKCGFNSHESFVYNFKKIFKLSPKEYRNKALKKEFIGWIHSDESGKLEIS